MIVSKILVGEGAGKHLPFAYARLRALVRAFPKGFATQRYEVEGALITIQQNGKFKAIWIIAAGRTYFEFQTSGFPIVLQSGTQDGVPYTSYKIGVIGVDVDGDKVTATLLGGKRDIFSSTLSRIGRQGQVQLADEQVRVFSEKPVTKNSQSYAWQLYDSFAARGSHTGVHYTDYHTFNEILFMHTARGSATSHFIRDIGYDQEWSDNKGFEKLRRASLAHSSSPDWPRRTALQIVKSEQYGVRHFGVCLDAFDQVTVFPTSAIGTDHKVNLASAKIARLPFPSWAYKKNVKFRDWYNANNTQPSDIYTGIYEFPEVDWKFNPDGTKVCAIVYERQEAIFNSAYFAPYATETGTQGKGTFYPDATSFNVMNAYTMGVDGMYNAWLPVGTKYYMSGPGLIESTITITITGDTEAEFDLVVNTTEIRRPTTTPYCTFCAGYVGSDIKVTNFNKDNPQYEARRGDLCVLDFECYGNLTTNKAATLWSLKNLTQAKEIRTFGASSAYTTGGMFSGTSSLISFDMSTLSFVFKYRNYVKTGTPPEHIITPFGISIFTLCRYRHTFFPNNIDPVHKTSILNKVDKNDRAIMTSELGSLSLMPLNDLRDWTDPMMQRLRERYTRSYSQSAATYWGAYSGNPQPYANPDISEVGFNYWKSGAPNYPSPTTEHLNWYNNIVRHALIKPYVLFYLDLPRPGWWQYMGHITQCMELNPHTTFYAHPNGTWAFFSQNFIYNANGLHNGVINSPGLGTSEWNPANMEHCIFDGVHLVVWSGEKSKSIDTTFIDLYNKAITKGKKDKSITDGTNNVALTDIRATWTAGTIVDPYKPSLTYAQMQINWPPGFTAFYRETAYYSGIKGDDLNFDPLMNGAAADLSLSYMWKQTTAADSYHIAPDQVHMPFTASTCVLITV